MWRYVARVGLPAAVMVLGCEEKAVRTASSAEDAHSCSHASGEKLAVPFMRLCPNDLPGLIKAPMWIARTPIGCSGGEHETVLCPAVVNLSPESITQRAATAQLVAAESAHRTCTMRFGGRLPTAEERAQALEASGLITIAITRGEDGSLSSHTVPEWVTERPCTSPSTMAPECLPRTFPASASIALPWTKLQSCTVAPPEPTGLRVAPGDTCPAPMTGVGARGDSALAAVCSFVPSNRDRHQGGVSLRCSPTLAPTQETLSPQLLAAFRCVVPAGSLAGTIREHGR